MTILKATDARAKLYRLLDEVAESHEPVVITGKRSNAVLVSEDDWRSIQETLHLLSVPGLRESIRDGIETPVDACSEDLAGELEGRLDEVGAEGRAQARICRSKAEGRRTARHSSRGSVAIALSV